MNTSKLLPAIFLAFLLGCASEKEEFNPEQTPGNGEPDLIENFVIHASGSGSRSDLLSDFSVKWLITDRLGMVRTSDFSGNYCLSTSLESLYNMGTSADFTASTPVEAGSYIAYYPYVTYSPRESYPIPISVSQKQESNFSHIAQYDILCSAPFEAEAGSEPPVLELSHMTSLIDINVKLSAYADDVTLKRVIFYADYARTEAVCTNTPFMSAAYIGIEDNVPYLASKSGYQTSKTELEFTSSPTLSSETAVNGRMIVAYKAAVAPPLTVVVETNKGFVKIEKGALAFTAGNVYTTQLTLNMSEASPINPMESIAGSYKVTVTTSGSNSNINNLGSIIYGYDEYCDWAEGASPYNGDAFKALNFDYCIATHGNSLLYPLCFKLTSNETAAGSGRYVINTLAVVEPGNTTTNVNSYYDSNTGEIHLDFSFSGSEYVFDLAAGESSVPGEEESGKLIYLPEASVSSYPEASGFSFRSSDLDNPDSYFCWERSKQTDNLILFWEKGFGSDPSTCTATVGGVSMTVDVDDMLSKMEAFYDCYANSMAMTVPGLSKADKYKMEIYLFYTSDWVANGGGVDNELGAFWIAPSACHPVGQTVAHELGHSFQYQVYCDDPSKQAGYRHSVGTGNAFWETTANYQAWKNLAYYPEWSSEIPYYQANAHKGFLHEWLRYQDFFIMNYWESIHGADIIGRIWRESLLGEDAMETYKRITSTSQSDMNDQIWESDCREMVWDFDNGNLMRSLISGLSDLDKINWYSNKNDLCLNTTDGYYRPTHDTSTIDHGTLYNRAFAPQSYGRNVIELTVPAEGTAVGIKFQGLSDYPSTADNAAYRYSSYLGWRWGFVACTGSDGWTPVYGTIHRNDYGYEEFTVPANTKRLFLIVSGAPTTHTQKLWDSDVTNDYEFPYRFKLYGASVNSNYNTISTEAETVTEVVTEGPAEGGEQSLGGGKIQSYTPNTF